MNLSNQTSECKSLMDACTLTLYEKNIFRITGLPVDATAKDVSKQVQKLQMLEEMGGETVAPKPAFARVSGSTSDEIRDALARMRDPEHRMVDEFFWYWPETFGNSKEEPAIQALLAGDAQEAVAIWTRREKGGSIVACHNLAIMYHMFAVDWTHYQIQAAVDKDQSGKIKKYWSESLDRWGDLIQSDELWAILKERVRSMEDDALTTGFGRRMQRLLPQALGRVNAEAALKLAELGLMGWAEFHVNLMNETHQDVDDSHATAELVLEPTKKRVQQHLASVTALADKNPRQGVALSTQVMAQCRPLMAIYDLFHGPDAHQRNDLFDQVAETVADLLVAYQKATGDNELFVNLLNEAMKYASGSHIRERLKTYIAIGEGNLRQKQLEPIYASINTISESSIGAVKKLQKIQNEIIPLMPQWAITLGSTSESYFGLANLIANVLRSISLAAHNSESDTETAAIAIRLALKLSIDRDLRNRIKEDLDTIDGILAERGKWNRTIHIRSDEFEINSNFVRYNATKIPKDVISGIRYGIFKHTVNGVTSCYYTISLRGGSQGIELDCKRVFRSETQAMEDFKAIIESLYDQMIPSLISRFTEYITSGSGPIQIGNLLLKREGVECDTGLLVWKKHHLIPYANLRFNNRDGSIHVASRLPEQVNFAFDRRRTWNAVILESLVDHIWKRNSR